MNKLLGVLFVCAAFFVGSFFFLIQGQYVLIKLPWFSYPLVESKASRAVEVARDVVCHLAREGLLVKIKKSILWPPSICDSIKRVIELWIACGVDENGAVELVKVQSVALTSQGTVALVSFDRSFIPAHLSTFDRWQLVESLLTTLRTTGIVLEALYFLQGQDFLADDYLDFSQRWPIGGYQAH